MSRNTPRHRQPRNDAERVAEARQHIAAIMATMNQGNNRHGEYGRNCRSSIARWEEVISRLTKLDPQQ